MVRTALERDPWRTRAQSPRPGWSWRGESGILCVSWRDLLLWFLSRASAFAFMSRLRVVDRRVDALGLPEMRAAAAANARSIGREGAIRVRAPPGRRRRPVARATTS